MKSMLWRAKIVRNSNICATNKISLGHSRPCSFTHCLWLLLCWALQVAPVVRDPLANAGDIRDVSSVSGSGGSPGEGHGNPLQYSCLENPMNRGAWWATVHGEAKESDMMEVTSCTHTQAFMLKWQRWGIIVHLRGPAKSELFTICPSAKQAHWPQYNY